MGLRLVHNRATEQGTNPAKDAGLLRERFGDDQVIAKLHSLAIRDTMLPAPHTVADAHDVYRNPHYKYHRLVLVEKDRAEKIWPTLNRRRETAVVVENQQEALRLARTLHASGPGLRDVFFANTSNQRQWQEMLAPAPVVNKPAPTGQLPLFH
jgi:hypothetical protein